jgi:hypothetical protein
VSLFLLHHTHDPGECRVAYAAWKGFASPLRHRTTIASCREGAHSIWWRVEARDRERALALLPAWVADRTAVLAVSEVTIP